MSFPDLTLKDPFGQLKAVFVVKSLCGTSREWAAEMRRNILAHGGFPKTEFFGLVMPDRIYLWKDAGVEPLVVPPSHEIDTRSIFEPYFSRAGIDSRDISRRSSWWSPHGSVI